MLLTSQEALSNNILHKDSNSHQVQNEAEKTKGHIQTFLGISKRLDSAIYHRQIPWNPQSVSENINKGHIQTFTREKGN